MIIEFSNYDVSLSDEETKAVFKTASELGVNTICVLPYHVKLAKNHLPDYINIACSVDFPLGINDTKTRLSAIDTAIKNGAQIINVAAQPNFFCNRKYDKFREDIKTLLEHCAQNNVKLRYILEYRIFSYELLYKVSQILLSSGVDTIYPSTGYFIDDINDNILASVLINKKVPINIICNGNIWNIGQLKNVFKSHVYGLKVNSINALKLIQENKLKF